MLLFDNKLICYYIKLSPSDNVSHLFVLVYHVCFIHSIGQANSKVNNIIILSELCYLGGTKKI